MFQQLLEKYNLTFEELNSAERATLLSWAEKLKTKTLTADDIKTHVASLITAVEKELAGLETPTSFWLWLFGAKRDVYVKARLKNYLMLQDFLLGPERARQFVETHLQNMKAK